MFVFVFVLLSNSIISAFAINGGDLVGLLDDTGGPVSTDPITFIQNAINWGVGLIALVAVVFLIIGGVKYITSSGDSKKVEEAQGTITNAVIGLVICFIAVFLVDQVIKIAGGW